MADREKVIRAVETCFNSWIDKHRNMGLDLHEVKQMKREALELLKEQEPKVLTRDEAIMLPEGMPVWFEESNDAGQTFISPMICHGNGLYGNRFMLVDAKQLYWPGRRFWTAKPDDEQRKAVKWDEIQD